MAAAWILLLVFFAERHADGLLPENCREPLGMESGKIPDRDITASSAYDSASVGPQHARLRIDKSGGAWCPRHMVTKEAEEYLEVNLHSLHAITGTLTQGRFGNGQGQEYVEEFMLDYWRPGLSKWIRWKSRHKKEKLAGNTNTYTVEEQHIDPPIRATKIRFVPFSDHVRTVCMRTELLGCASHGGFISYSMRQGFKSDDLDFRDTSYDGFEETGFLQGGLGQLTDNERGQDSYVKGFEKGTEWVGWRSDTPPRPVEVVFEFDTVRNFSAMRIHTSNLFSKDIQVFSRAEVFFSINGRLFAPEPVSFSYMPDLIIEHARNVTVKLHNRIGRFVKVKLHFAARFLLVSEINFDSVSISGNFTDDDEENTIPISPDQGLFPLQRDDGQTTPSRDDQQLPAPPLTGSEPSGESRQYIGPVIGGLSTIIIILLVAILFMVVRSRRLKATGAILPGSFTAIGCQKPTKGLQMQLNGGLYGQVCVDDNEEKTGMYHKPISMNTYTGGPTELNSKQIDRRLPPEGCLMPVPPSLTSKNVPDVLGPSPEYAVPHVGHPPSPPRSPMRPPPSLQDILPKPTPGAPPDHFQQPVAPRRPSVSSTKGTASEPSLRRCRGAGVSCQSLSRLLTDATDSEFPPTETETEDEDNITPVPHIRLDRLRLLEQLGFGQFGEVQVCELKDTHELVAVKFLSDLNMLREFRQEARLLYRIQNDHIVRVLGASLDEDPRFLVLEYSSLGDLNAFLQDHIADTAVPLPCNAKTLSYGCLIYMATQIASGMKYLESLNFVHRDLATRNCLVSDGYRIRICDLGTCRPQYSSDYVTLESPPALPLRWMAWESVILGKFSTKSDVWAFAVTLWEVLTFAREQPFEDLTDDNVLGNISAYYKNIDKPMLLEKPKNCPKEIYDLMRECWQRNEVDRPNFREIHLFLQRKNLGYRPPMDSHKIGRSASSNV